MPLPKYNSQWFAVGLIVFLIVVTVLVVFPLMKWNKENNELSKSRNYYISFSNWINIAQGEAESDTFWQIDLTVNQPRGTLIIGDCVEISGNAIVKTTVNQNITEIRLWFRNSQAYNITFDSDGMINATDSNIHLIRIGDTNKLEGNATICWRLEGSYNPTAQIFFENETGNFTCYLGVSPDVAITVYPESEFAQIVNNEVTMVLTIAVYSFTVIGTFSLILTLWRMKPSSNNKENNSESSNSNTNIKDNCTNKNVIESNNSNRKKKRTPKHKK